jgi:hypothetical protein
VSGGRVRNIARHAGVMTVTVAVAFVLAVAAEAAPSRTLDTVLTGTVTATGGWCCGGYWTFQGSAVIPSIGKVGFTATYTAGVIPVFVVQPDEVRALVLTLATPDGSTLVLTSRVEWPFVRFDDPGPPLVWTVAQATGRFANYTGTGVYTATAGSTTVSILLSGELTA